MRKKEICIILPSLSGGGAEKVGVTIANSLHERGWRVILLVISGKDRKYERFINKNIEYYLLNIPLVLSFFKLLKFVKAIKPKTILSFSIEVSSFLIIMRKISNYEFTLFTRPMNLMSLSSSETRLYWRILNDFFLKKIAIKSNFIIAQSLSIKKDLINNFAVTENKIFVINNPAFLLNSSSEDSDNYKNYCAFFQGLNTNAKIVLFVGRFSVQKNLFFLIEVFITLTSEIDFPVYLFMVGEGPEKKVVEHFVTNQNLNHYIKLFPFTENISIFYKKATVTVLTSIYEGFPNVLLESISVGTPIIAFESLGGIEELIIDGVNGFKTKYLNKDDFKRKLKKSLDFQWDKEKIIKSSDRFSISNIVDEYENVLLKNNI